MTLQSAASDLALLEDAARAAGALARELLTKPLDIKSKGEAGPVTNIDLAVDALLTARLRAARPDYGWLSEEAPDAPAERLGKARVFMLDPIDGTAAMIERSPQFTVSIGITHEGAPWAGAVYNPMTDQLYTGAIGLGAWMNGRAIRASAQTTIEGARMIGQPSRFAAKRWPEPWPKMSIESRQSIAYRLALVAAGEGDATILFGPKHAWDVAGGAAIVEAAGGRVTDPWGRPLALNEPAPSAPGTVAAGAALHPLIIERTSHFPDPRKAQGK